MGHRHATRRKETDASNRLQEPPMSLGRILHATLAALAIALTTIAATTVPVRAQTAPGAFETGYRWDSARRLVGRISPSSNGTAAPFVAVRYTYDPDGALIRTEEGYLDNWQAETVLPVNWIGFHVTLDRGQVYDPAGNKVQDSLGSGSGVYGLTQYSYDAAGRLECTAIRMNPGSWGALPNDACTLGPTGSDGPDRIARSVYDAAGQLLKTQKAYNVTTANGFPVTLLDCTP